MLCHLKILYGEIRRAASLLFLGYIVRFMLIEKYQKISQCNVAILPMWIKFYSVILMILYKNVYGLLKTYFLINLTSGIYFTGN